MGSNPDTRVVCGKLVSSCIGLLRFKDGIFETCVAIYIAITTKTLKQEDYDVVY